MKLQGGTYTAAANTTLTVEGQATASASSFYTNTRGLRVDDTLNTKGTVTLKGSSSNSDGLLVQTGGINVLTGALSLMGTMTANGAISGQSGVQINKAITLNNGTTLNITGNTANASTGIGFAETGVLINANAPISQAAGQTTAGDITITGYSSSWGNSNGVNINSAISTGTGNIKIIGQRQAGGNGASFNTTSNITTLGNVTIQGIGGSVTQSSGTISGANITIDNTGAGLTSLIADNTGGPALNLLMGGSISSTAGTGFGVISAGSGGNIYGTGVTVAGTLTSAGNINIQGNVTGSASTTGMTIASGAMITTTGTNSTNTIASNYNLIDNGTINNNIGTGSSTKLRSTLGSVSGSGNIATTATAAGGGTGITIDTATDGTMSGGISGTGGLIKLGAGTTTLTNANTYSGTTTVTAGTLQVGNGGTSGRLGSGDVSIATNSNLTFYRNDSSLYTIANNITSAGTINFLGTGTLGQSQYALSGANASLGGAINISNSRLTVSASSQVGTAAINVISGASLFANGGIPGITLNNALTLAGNGWNESSGYLGALRLQNVVQAGNITLAADTRINAWNSTGTISGVISGGKNLEFTNGFNNATITLTRTNTYSGSTTIASGTTLQLGNGVTTGTIANTSPITDNGSLVVNNLDTVILSQNITGSGTLTQSGTGTTKLTGTNNYGTTTISGGTLQVGDGGTTGTLGSGAVTVGTGANLNFNRSNAITVANTISGPGKVSQNGSGAGTASNLKLTGDVSGARGVFDLNYGQMTFDNLNSNRLFNGSQININNKSTLNINGNSNANWYAFGTTFNFDSNGGGTIAIGNPNFAAGWTTTSKTATFKTNGGLTNNITGTGINLSSGTGGINAVFDIAAGAGGTPGLNYSAGFSLGPGPITKTGAGTMLLTNASTNAQNITYTINQGTLQVGNADTTGYLGATGAISIASDANLTFNRSDINTVSNKISGAGTVNQVGLGTTVLTAANDYTGPTTITAGTLQIGNGATTGTLGTGDVSMFNGSNLVYSRAANTVIANKITGDGNVSATITGTLDVSKDITLSGTGNTINLQASGNITESAGSMGATNLYLKSTGGAIGTSVQRIQSNVSNLSLSSSGSQYLTEADDVTVSSATTSNGMVDIKTTAGTLTVGAVNAVNGISANGSGKVVLSAGGTSKDVVLNQAVSSVTGEVNILASGSLNLGANISTSGDAFLQAAAGTIGGTGNVAANNLALTAGSGIGTSAARLQTNVAGLGISAGGDVFVTETNAVTVAGKTTNNGSLDIVATNGTLDVRGLNIAPSVSGNAAGINLTGLVANGTGGVTLVGSDITSGAVNPDGTLTIGSDGVGIYAAVTAGNKGISITGTSKNKVGVAFRGGSAISGGDLTIKGYGTNRGGVYVALNNSMQADGVLSIEGRTTNNLSTDNFAYGVAFESGSSITASDKAGSAISILGELTHATAGGTSTRGAINLGGSITNNSTGGGTTTITAVTDSVYAFAGTGGSGNPGYAGATITNALNAGKITITAGTDSASTGGVDFSKVVNNIPWGINAKMTVTQNSAAGVEVSSTGQGHVVAPLVVNNGAGNVVIAAGTAITAPTGTGGQVKTTANDTDSLVTQTSTGQTFIYSGNLIETGTLGKLSSSLSTLFATAVDGNAQNLGSSKAYGDTLMGGAAVQALFREKVDLGTVDFSATVNKTYGDTGYTQSLLSGGAAKLKTDLSSALANLAGDTVTSASGVQFSKSALVKQMGLSSADWANTNNFSTSSNLKASSSANSFVLTNNSDFTVSTTGTDVKLKIDQKALTGVTIDAAGNTYGDPVSAGAVNFAGSNKVSGDQIGGTASVQSTAADLSSSGKLKYKASGYDQTVSAITSTNANNDADNYTFTPVTTTGNYSVSKLSISASIDAVTTTYGTNAATGGVNLIGVIGVDQVSPSGSALTGGVFSSSNNLKAGTYAQSVGGALSGTDADNYSFSGTSSANYVVNKLALNTQIAGVTTTYGTTAATGAASITGVLSGDKVDLVNAKATLVDAANSSSGQLKAGTYKQTVANSLSGADADNYTAAPTSLANYVVTPKAITATVTAADKVYDGSNVATLTANSADIVSGDVVNVLGATGTFASKNVVRDGAGNAVAQTVTVAGTGVGLGGADGANYTLTNATSIASTTAKITPKDLSVTGITASDKVYDGSTTAAINTAAAVLAGVVVGDSVSVSTQSGMGNFADKNAATNKAVTVAGLNLSGADAGNYTVTDASGAKAAITPKDLVVTGITGIDRVYDSSTMVAVSTVGVATAGKVAGDNLTLLTQLAQGNVADKNVGTNKLVSVTGLGLSGSDASNYSIVEASAAKASITPKAITATGITATGKVYDSAATAALVTTGATLTTGASSATDNKVYGSDAVSLVTATASGSFADKNVGADKAVTVSGLSLLGADAGNYTVSDASGAKATITPKAITVTGISANGKIYDSSVTATLVTTGAALATGASNATDNKVYSEDAVSLVTSAAAGSFADKNAGANKAVFVNGLSLSGTDAANYTVTDASGAKATITPKAITVTGITANGKVYDATVSATLVTTGAVLAMGASSANDNKVYSTDVVSLVTAAATGSFADKNVGADKAVTVSGLGLSGTDAANYTVSDFSGAKATITPKALTVTGITASDKVYDGSTIAAINTGAAVMAGIMGGDNVSVSTQSAVGNLASKNVAFDGTGTVVNQAVRVSGLSLTGGDAGNYTVADQSGATARVLQRALSITGSVAQDKTVDGNTQAVILPGQLGNLVSGESLIFSASGQFDTAELGTNKAVNTVYALANGSNGIASNYTLAGEVLRASILSATQNLIQPINSPAKSGSSGRVTVAGSSNAGGATGTSDDKPIDPEARNECSVINPEKCECQASTIAGVEMCFAPGLAPKDGE